MQVIESNNELLLKLIGDILDLSKVEAGSMEYTHSEFDLNKLMEDMNGTLQLRLDKKKQVVLSYKCGLEQCVIRSERNRLT
ncbi:UNVERIFIED_CONTAM: PAS domain-containing sensor histidine kinase, partial [Bacteroidetes bacterium 56_B9]